MKIDPTKENTNIILYDINITIESRIIIISDPRT